MIGIKTVGDYVYERRSFLFASKRKLMNTSTDLFLIKYPNAFQESFVVFFVQKHVAFVYPLIIDVIILVVSKHYFSHSHCRSIALGSQAPKWMSTEDVAGGGILKHMEFSNPEDNVRRLHLTEGMHVADFGTGTGAYAFALAAAVGPSGRVYALDVQKDLLSRLKKEAEAKKVGQLEVVWCNLDTLGGTKLVDSSLDAAVLANVLFQSEHKEHFLLELARVLKPGALILVVDWSASFAGMGPHPDQVVSEGTAKELLGKVGFLYKDAFFAGAHHYGLLYMKT